MESKKINQLATELAPDLSDLTIIGDPTTGISKKITLSQMASLFTGTVEEYANFAAFPLVGVADTIYVAKDTNVIYRWDSTAYVVLSPNIIASLVFNDANGFDGTISLVGSVATLTITTALTTGSVGFIGASGALLQDNANFFWDDTNNRLGLGTNAPTTALDVFGSGIIGRINGTSTNNAFLGFASAGTNRWSIGNVQADHRFRIYSEANSAELVSVLQTGEFGIGIANPLTKFHIFGGASALIANLDANTSVAKSISYRSGNSSRINLEVSGTESGTNAGMDFFLRTYSDAGALLATPLTITRSTGAATFSNSATATAFIPTGSSVPTNGMYLSASNILNFATNTTNRLTIDSLGNLGLGITPYSWDSIFKSIDLVNGASFASYQNYVAITSNLFYSSSVWKYKNTGFGAAINLESDSGNIVFRSAASGTAGSTATLNERMRMLSNGNFGIGTATPSYRFEVSNSGSGVTVGDFYVDTANNAVYVGRQSSTSGDNSKFYVRNRVNTLTALSVDPGGNGAVDIVGTLTNTRGVTLCSSIGNVGIGISAYDWNTIFRGIDFANKGGIHSYTNYIALTQNLYYGSGSFDGWRYKDTGFGAAINCESDSGDITFRNTSTSGSANGAATLNETMRLKSDRNQINYGNIFLNQTAVGTVNANATSIGINGIYYMNRGSGSGLSHIIFSNGGNVVGSVSSNTTNTQFNTSSDYRLKKDLQDFNALDILSNIKLYDFAWKLNDSRMYGVLAHELKEIIPYAVVGEKDEIDEEGNIKSQGVDYSLITPILAKAIQELKAEIEELKAKIK